MKKKLKQKMTISIPDERKSLFSISESLRFVYYCFIIEIKHFLIRLRHKQKERAE
jgi:hypothetical protein